MRCLVIRRVGTPLRKDRSRLAETGHTVVVGWSDQVFTVVGELVLANESEPRSCVAILADRDKVAMEDELRTRVGRTGTTRVVCRTGSPTEPTDLEIMALDRAKAVINFATLAEAARLRDETAIGWRLRAASLVPPSYGVDLNPDKHEPVTFGPEDQVIVLSRD